MACKGCLECLLKFLNFFLTLSGLAIIGYGIYLFVEFSKSSADDSSTAPTSGDIIQMGRPMLIAVSLSSSFWDNLPKEWFIFLFVGVGAVLFVVSCFGCIGAATRNGCCLTCYALLVLLLILVEVGCAAFIFFDKSWQEDIPTDKTGDFDMIYEFLDDNWDIVKWIALGIVIFQALLFLLALVVRAVNSPAEYDSDDEYIGVPRQQIRQPLINRPPVTAPAPVAGALDQRPSRNDAWSARMRESTGLTHLSSHTIRQSRTGTHKERNQQKRRRGVVLLCNPIYTVFRLFRIDLSINWRENYVSGGENFFLFCIESVERELTHLTLLRFCVAVPSYPPHGTFHWKSL